MNTPYAARRDRLRQLIRARGLDALLVSHAANRFYLSGFELHDVQLNESAGRLVICADGRDWLCTDARYKDAAARLWDEDRILIYGPDAATEIGQLMRRCGSRLGLEAEIVSLNFARSLGRAVGRGAHLQAADGLVEELRVIKDADEIKALERSFALNHAMLRWLEESQLQPGRSEAELAWAIEKYFRDNGASELAFPSIVAVDQNAALPHAIPGEKKLPDNGLVLVDDINPADPESDSRVWYLPTGSTQPTLVWSGDFSLYITEADQIAFISWAWSLDSSVLYSYDPVTGTLSSRDLGECIQINSLFTLVRDGSLRYYYSQYKDEERTSWVYDTATDTTTPLTRFDGGLYVSWLSPDGQYWAEQDPSTDDPRLRVSRWEY